MNQTELLVLAAGRGSRLGALTETIPKCLLEVGGVALLDWQLRANEQAGIARATVVTGYSADLISSRGHRTIFNPDWQSSEMVASLFLGLSHIDPDADVLVSYSDIVYTSEPGQKLLSLESPVGIAADEDWRELWTARFEDPLSDAETFMKDKRTGLLSKIGDTPTSFDQIEAQYMGLVVIKAEARELLERVWNSQGSLGVHLTSLLQQAISSGIEIGVASIRGNWFEIDSELDLSLANSWLESGKLVLAR